LNDGDNLAEAINILLRNLLAWKLAKRAEDQMKKSAKKCTICEKMARFDVIQLAARAILAKGFFISNKAAITLLYVFQNFQH